MTIKTDEHGRLAGLRCHDGHLLAVEIRERNVELKFRRLDDTRVQIVLEGVRKLCVNHFLEGNIVDTVYLWDLAKAPPNQRTDAAAAFLLDESEFDRMSGTERLFVLESSYGATVYAVVEQIRIE